MAGTHPRPARPGARRPSACRSTTSTRRARCWSVRRPGETAAGVAPEAAASAFLRAGDRRRGWSRTSWELRGVRARPAPSARPDDVADPDEDLVRALDADASKLMVERIDEAHRTVSTLGGGGRGRGPRSAAWAAVSTRTGTGGRQPDAGADGHRGDQGRRGRRRASTRGDRGSRPTTRSSARGRDRRRRDAARHRGGMST